MISLPDRRAISTLSSDQGEQTDQDGYNDQASDTGKIGKMVKMVKPEGAQENGKMLKPAGPQKDANGKMVKLTSATKW